MALVGQGLIAIWNDIKREMRDEFYAWHDNEHMLERVDTEGFRRGRRYRRLDAEIEWLTLYETADEAVLAGAAYLERLNNPTGWTKRTVAGFLNVTRVLCSVRASIGEGAGGLIMASAFNVRDRAPDELEAMVRELAAQNEVAGAHFALTDRGASSIVTEEKKDRVASIELADAVVLVEASRLPALVRAADRLSAMGEDHVQFVRRPGIYQLEITFDAPDRR